MRSEVQDKINDLKNILETGSTEELRRKTHDLSLSLQKIGAAMYQQQPPPPPPGGGEGEEEKPGGDEDVVEGEFREA